MSEEKEITVNGLLKVGKEEHIHDLQKNGHLYCNTVKWFREVEKSDKNRHDGREGAFKTEVLDNPENFTISVDGKPLTLKPTHVRINEFYENRSKLKLYCLFGFKEKHANGSYFIDKRVEEFGPKALVILNVAEFIKRVESKLRELELGCKYNFVNYYKENGVNENLTVFDKPKRFEYQNEFRLLFYEISPTPLSIKIGSIEDISIMLETEKLSKLSLERQ